MRVPTATVSITNLVCELSRPVTVEEVNKTFKRASEGLLEGILGYSEEPLVSIDYRGDDRSSIIDGLSTMVSNNMVKVVSWYDNEWAYSCRTVDLVNYVAEEMEKNHENTEKISLAFAGFSAASVARINLVETIGSAYPRLIEQPVIPLSDLAVTYYKEYFALIARASCDKSITIDPKMADMAILTILTSLQMMYQKFPEDTRLNRKKEIYRDLIQLITEHYKEQRCAQFYADKLGISLQYLSTAIKDVTGKNVLSTIAYIVIIDAKARLKGTTMTIQEIAYSLNFPNPSFFCKFFRRHVGMSPVEFRNS